MAWSSTSYPPASTVLFLPSTPTLTIPLTRRVREIRHASGLCSRVAQVITVAADASTHGILTPSEFERKQLMKKAKRRVRRLTLYLRSIGIQPCTELGTQSQYDQLDQEQRKLARRIGRQLLIQSGSIAKAIVALSSHLVQETLAGDPPPIVPRNRSREEQFLHNLSRWSPLTPPCPSCRMGCGFPKRSWPTREWADEVRGRQHDQDMLRVFECPVQPGYWHLGHVGRRTASMANPDNSSIRSISPCPPLAGP